MDKKGKQGQRQGWIDLLREVCIEEMAPEGKDESKGDVRNAGRKEGAIGL